MKQDYIIYRGDIGEEMFFIVTGSVHIMSSNEEKVLATLKEDDYFGEIALFSEDSKRLCSVISTTYTKTYKLTKESLNFLFKKFP